SQDGSWQQSEVLPEPRVQLRDGLNRTKETPTSVPTTTHASKVSCAVGRHRRWGTRRQKAERDSVLSADQIRACDQSQDGQGARPDHPTNAPRDRRRGDRMMSPVRGNAARFARPELFRVWRLSRNLLLDQSIAGFDPNPTTGAQRALQI